MRLRGLSETSEPKGHSMKYRTCESRRNVYFVPDFPMMTVTLRTIVGLVSALWGLLGVSFLLGGAVVRLTPWALEALRMELAWHHWTLITQRLLHG